LLKVRAAVADRESETARLKRTVLETKRDCTLEVRRVVDEYSGRADSTTSVLVSCSLLFCGR
jgi:hypothetical protein